MSVYSTERPPDKVTKRKRRRDAWAWLAVLGAPIVWLTHLQLIYSIAWWSYRSGRTWPMHVAVVVSLVLCAMVGWLAWRTHRGLKQDATPDQNEVENERVRLMADMGLWGTALFVLGIFGQWLAVFMVMPTVD